MTFFPLTSADLPEAQWFVARVRGSACPISGLQLLSKVCLRGGTYDTATDMLRALEDRGVIQCAGPDKTCPMTWRGDLLGQLYQSK